MTEHEQPRRARHLMDPNNPRQVRRRNDAMSLDTVQKWVLSALAAVTILHLSAGLIIAALFVGDDQTSARVGLNILGGAFGIVAVAAARAIHGKTIASPWLLLGLIPGAIGFWLTFR
ncbi:MAG: hypothetical protein JWO11_3354 [Nocardioides sp.]|nr:hypothetical protein [Nocardioides sp.]